MKLHHLNSLTLPAVFEQSEPADTRQPLYFDLDGQPLSYAIFYNRVELVSELLRKHGVKQGKAVAILSENLANWAIAYFAIAKLGAVALPLLSELNDEDIEGILKRYEVSIVFASQSAAEQMNKLHIEGLNTLIALKDFKVHKLNKGKENVQEIIGRELDKLKKSAMEFIGYGEMEEDTPTVAEDDTCCILHFPDVNGNLKAIRLTHKNLVATALGSAEALQLTAKTRIMILLPLSLTLPAVLGILLPLVSETQAVFLPQTTDEKVLREWINRFRPTHLLTDSSNMTELYKKLAAERSVLSLLKRPLKLLKHILGKSDVPSDLFSMKFFKNFHWLICTNFTPLGPKLRQFLLEKEIAHHTLFGLLETSSLILTGRASREFCWVQGRLLPGMSMRIVAEGPQADYGELWVKGPMVAPDFARQDSKGKGFFPTGFAARQAKDELQILGPMARALNGEEKTPLFRDLISAALKECKEVKEACVSEEDGKIVARISLAEHQTEVLEQTSPERLLTQLRQKVNATLPEYAQLDALFIESEPERNKVKNDRTESESN